MLDGLDFCTEGTDPATDLGPLNHSGTCYSSYMIKIGQLVVLNAAIAYLVEAYFIHNFTIAYDKRTEKNKIHMF